MSRGRAEATERPWNSGIRYAIEAEGICQWNEAIEAAAKWHEAQAIASDSRITHARHVGYAKALRNLRKEPKP